MLQRRIGDTNVCFATNLRVAFKLKELTRAKTLQETVSNISKLDFDGKLQLLYAAYIAVPENAPMSFDAFQNLIGENLGIYAIADLINEVADGLLYAGLDDDTKSAKKKEAEEMLVGERSSAKPTEQD